MNVESLVITYQKAQQSLINLIATKEARGTSTLYQKTLLAQINKELARLTQDAQGWAESVLPKEYKAGVQAANQGLTNLGVESVPAYETFAKLHTSQVELLIQNAKQDLIEANMFVGRQLQDSIRQAGIEAIAQKTAQGQTVKETKKLLTQALIDQGLNGIKMRNGAMMRLDSYAELVARSTSREAQNKGMLNQMTSLGYDLVQMSTHKTSCAVCAALQGRVYSISGNDKRYPPLTRAYNGVHANIHPRCRHVLAPYVEHLADNPENDREYSNRDFIVDEKSQKDIDNYNKIQKEKAQLRNDRRQWEKYKLALPDQAPKTLSGFRRMKQAESLKYKELKASYLSQKA